MEQKVPPPPSHETALHVLDHEWAALGLCRISLLCHGCRAGGPGVGRKIALDVARGLTFLHSNRIAHMDLKTLNGNVCSATATRAAQ